MPAGDGTARSTNQDSSFGVLKGSMNALEFSGSLSQANHFLNSSMSVVFLGIGTSKVEEPTDLVIFPGLDFHFSSGNRGRRSKFAGNFKGKSRKMPGGGESRVLSRVREIIWVRT